MLKILILKRRTLYIALFLLLILIIGIVFYTISDSDETFSEKIKYDYKKISYEQAKVLLEKNPDAIVFDIRNEEEYLEGHLPNATQLSYKEIQKKLNYYSPEKIYMIYGGSNKKSEKAAEVMANHGFSKIYMLNGGIEDWPYEIE